jgi:hypothetical protein
LFSGFSAVIINCLVDKKLPEREIQITSSQVPVHAQMINQVVTRKPFGSLMWKRRCD